MDFRSGLRQRRENENHLSWPKTGKGLGDNLKRSDLKKWYLKH